MKAYARNSTEYTAWTRDVVVELDDKTYHGTLTYSWDGYDWDGEEIPGVEMDQEWFYDLDTLTCDQSDCTGCELLGVK